MNEFGVLVEWFWRGKTEVPEEKPLPAIVCLLHVPHGLAWDWTPACMMKGHQLSAWAITQHTTVNVKFHVFWCDTIWFGSYMALYPKKTQLSIIYSVYLLLLVCLLYSRWQHCCIATNSATQSAVLSSVIKNTVCRNYSVIMDRNGTLLIYPYDPNTTR